jgi:phage-related minor tail protein
MGEALGITQEQALGMTNTLLKMGFPPEQIDIISEYGSQLSRAGYTAQEIQGVFAAGIETKSWNIDVLLDGIKEGRIRLAEFGGGIDKTTAALIEGTSISGEQLKQWGNDIASGGEQGKQAMSEVSLALATVENDTLRNQIGTRLFGTLWEEQGEKITTVLDGATEKTGNLKTNVDGMNQSIAATDASSQVELNNALTAMNTALQPLYIAIANFVTKMAEWVQSNPQIASGIAIVTGAIAALLGVIPALVTIFGVVRTVFGVVANVARIVGVAIAGISAPVWIAIAAIAAIIAIGVALYKNWKTISDGAMEMSRTVGRNFNEMHDAVGRQMQQIEATIKRVWNSALSFLKGIDLSSIGRNIIQGLVNGIKGMGGAVSAAVKSLAAKVPDGLSKFLKMGSPSKLTEQLGEFTGEGFSIGLKNSIGNISDTTKRMAAAAVPDTKGAKTASIAKTATIAGKSLTVNLHSPKALDVREANRVFNRTLNTMSLMW